MNRYRLVSRSGTPNLRTRTLIGVEKQQHQQNKHNESWCIKEIYRLLLSSIPRASISSGSFEYTLVYKRWIVCTYSDRELLDIFCWQVE